VVAHSKAVAGPTAVVPLVIAHIEVEVADPTAADHIEMVAIEADPQVVAHTVVEVAIVDYP